jgi:glycosyltransferase involved in cell wall biosynthesis
MKIVFINRYFHPDQSATSQMLSSVAFSLAAQGHDVRVITSRLLYDDAQEPLAQSETVKGVQVHRVRTTSFGRRGLRGRAVDYLTFWVSAGGALWRLTERGDVVVAKTDPPLLSVLAWPLARWRGAHAVNWLQDIYPETAEALGMGQGRIGRALFGVLRGLRDRSLRAAAMNVALGERMAAFLKSRGVAGERIRVIANFADDAVIRPAPASADSSMRREWGLNGAFVVGYSGNLGRAHEYETLLDAMTRIDARQRRASQEARRIAFLFVGGGALYDRLKSEVAERRLAIAQFRPFQPADKLSGSLAVPDLHLVSLRPELEGFIVPSKFYGITAAERPTLYLGDEDGEIARLIARHRCGVTVPLGDGARLAQAIEELAAAPARCSDMGTRAQRAFETEFRKEIAIERWSELLHELAADRVTQCPAARDASDSARKVS